MPKSELHRRKMADKKSKRQPDEPTPVIDSSSEDDDEPGVPPFLFEGLLLAAAPLRAHLLKVGDERGARHADGG